VKVGRLVNVKKKTYKFLKRRWWELESYFRLYVITINTNWFKARIGGVPLDDNIEQLSKPTTRYPIGVAPKDIKRILSDCP
jgi:hypothetical protein